jgi:hypothetical protein
MVFMSNMDVHIVFGDTAAGTLKAALRDAGVDDFRERVIAFSDLFSIGPIWQLHTEEGRKNRFDWLNKHFSHEPCDHFEKEYLTSSSRTLARIDAIDSTASICIWIGENAHEPTGLRYVLYVMRERTNMISVLNVKNASPKQKQSGGFEPICLGELSPKIIKELIRNHQRPHLISMEERERLAEEWTSLADSKAVL